MKRFILICFLIFGFSRPVDAISLIGSCVTSGCNPASNEIGNRDVEANASAQGADSIWMFRLQADCTGDLDQAYFYSTQDATNGILKICIYNSTDTTPVTDSAADSLVECSPEITTTEGVGWESPATFASGEGVVSGNWYWFVFLTSSFSATLNSVKANETTIYYDLSAGIYASPPASLNGISFDNEASYGDLSAYATIK